MSRGKGNKNGFSAKELEVILRARRERKAVSFSSGFPTIIDNPCAPKKTNAATKNAAQDTGEPIELQTGSILLPVQDLLQMVQSLEMYASHYSEALSHVERKREDCTHELEPCSAREELTDNELLLISRKLRSVCIERRNVKNRYEVIQFIRRTFDAGQGKEVLAFLRNLIRDVANMQKAQSQRTYSRRTDVLDELEDLRRCE